MSSTSSPQQPHDRTCANCKIFGWKQPDLKISPLKKPDQEKSPLKKPDQETWVSVGGRRDQNRNGKPQLLLHKDKIPSAGKYRYAVNLTPNR